MDYVQKVLELSGLKELNPVQKLAIDSGLLEGKSMVVAAPTASGKTLVAEMAALKTIRDGKKVVYIVPLKALASEKYEEFKKKYEPLGIRVAISVGDLDSTDPWLSKYDLIVVTSEKLDSLMRHGIEWVGSIGLVVVDEMHLLNDLSRGPTLEITLTKLRQLVNPWFLGLSATISNYEQLAGWLGAEGIKSDYRPVKLSKAVCFSKKIHFYPKGAAELNSETAEDSLTEIIGNTLSIGKQAMVFVSTRKSAEALAEKLGNIFYGRLSPEEKLKLEKLSKDVLNALEHPTAQCKKLSECAKKSVAFHHAGAVGRQRHLIENAFKDGLVKVITATPTLAMGINLPAYQVIIRDLKRFYSFKGTDYLPALEIEQMSGRAGRPRYDTEGVAVLMAKTKAEAEHAWENYLKGGPENITSKLGVEPILRMHTLGLIASGITPDKKDLFEFFSKTFYAFQYGDMGSIYNILDRIIQQLKEFNFITVEYENQNSDNPFRKVSEIQIDALHNISNASGAYSGENPKLMPTKIGKRVSELYIDPLTAHGIIEALDIANKKKIRHFGYLHIISDTIEMRPLISARKRDMETINNLLMEEQGNLVKIPPNEWEWEYDEFMDSIKTALVLDSWTREMGEDRILEDFNITPGEVRTRLDIADWLLYATSELALLLGLMEILKDIRKARVRVQYGVKEELLPLIRLKGIGRVRARKLYNAGLKKLEDLRKADTIAIARSVGEKTAAEIKSQLGERKETGFEENFYWFFNAAQ